MKIEIDQDTCVSAGQCVLSAPEVFDQRDDDGAVALLDATPPEAQHKAVHEAAQLCPTLAITLREN